MRSANNVMAAVFLFAPPTSMLASSHPVELLHGIALRNDLMRLQCMGPQLAYDGSGLATGEVVDKELDPQKEGYRTKLVRKVKATLR